MTDPIAIHRDYSTSQDARFDDDGMSSASFGSNCTELSLPSQDVIVADQWIVSGKIGEGSFGEVFKVRGTKTNKCYAIKRENLKTKHSQLKYESTMYDILSGGVGIPRCHWQGQFDGFECIIIDLLGPNLSQVRQHVSTMELDIAIDLVCQMVSIVEEIHNRGVIVRDIKPDNFLFSSRHRLPETETIETKDEFGIPSTCNKKRTCRQVFDEQWGDSHPRIYAVDFGLACYWRDPETGKTYPDTKKHIRSKTGTARYASINVHRGRSHSRRDDVESLGYILLDLLLGTLPWTGIHARNSKAGWDKMRQLKIDTFMSDLCAGLPNGVLKFVEYPRKLQFGDQPDYEKMRQYLQGSLPGGANADLVKSPFGGQTKSTENYDTIQQELKQIQEKQLQQQQEILDQYNRNIQNETQKDGFIMDHATQQLAKTTLADPKMDDAHQSQQRKVSTASQSSLQKLLKANLRKVDGWNTYKHDQAPWNPKTTWTNDDELTGSNLARSWGDDHKEQGTWGDPPTSTQVELAGPWGNADDANQIKWNEQVSWGTTTTAHHDKKKSRNADSGMPAATWGEQPSWDTAHAIQHNKKVPMDHTTEPKRSNQSSWKATTTTQHTKKEPRNSMTSSRAPPRTNHSNKTDTKNFGDQMKWQKRDDHSTWETKQDQHNSLWSTTDKTNQPGHQWKEVSPWTNSTEEVDGWQRKPGSNSWQQKRRPLAK